MNGHVAKEQCIGTLGTIETLHDILERPCQQSSSYLLHTVTYGPTGLIENVQNSLFGKKQYAHDGLSQIKKENDRVYSFDSLGNPTDSQIGACNEILGTSQCTVSYDPDGNPLERLENGRSTRYRYDALGRLIEIAEPGQTTRYVYDPLSRLLFKETKETADGKVFFLYDQDKEIGTVDEHGKIRELKILGLGLKGDIGAAVALEIEGELFAPVHDLGGNLIALVNSQGQVVESYDMDAFGNAPSTTPPINPWRFCSKRSMGQLIFFGLRFYDPSLGRWLTPDPSGFADGPNQYLYVCNNPLRRLDLFGLFSEDRFGLPAQIHVPVTLIPRMPIVTSIRVQGLIDGTRVDYFLQCGYWHQLQFTPEELHAGKINLVDHLGEIFPTSGRCFGLVGFGNGINTTLDEFGDMCEATAKKIGSTLFIGLYNPTQGVIRDGYRTLKEQSGVSTPTVCRTRQFLATIAEAIHKVNPDALWLYLAHSENGVISKRAVEGLSAEAKALLQRELYMYALGPAEPLPMYIGQSVINTYSEKDGITKWFAKPFIHDKDYDIRFIKCETPRSERILWLADHSYLTPTYLNDWTRYIRELRKTHTFYQGSSHEQNR